MEGEVTVTVVVNLTMKINKMEETMDTTTMLLLVDVVAVEGEEVVEEEEDVVDTTDRKDHRTMQLLK